MTADLLATAIELRTATGRATTAEDSARLARKIAGMTQAEQTFERSAMSKMLRDLSRK